MRHGCPPCGCSAASHEQGRREGRDLEDAEVLQVVASLVKQRRDSIEQFAKAGRTDLVEKETGELAVLQAYLPPSAAPEEINAPRSPRPLPKPVRRRRKTSAKVMKAVMPKLAGKNADGKAVNDAVRRALGS